LAHLFDFGQFAGNRCLLVVAGHTATSVTVPANVGGYRQATSRQVSATVEKFKEADLSESYRRSLMHRKATSTFRVMPKHEGDTHPR